MVNRRQVIAWVLALAGCARELGQPFVRGQRVPAPAAWVDYCRRNPMDSAC